jgi:hypothetical protein
MFRVKKLKKIGLFAPEHEGTMILENTSSDTF